MPVSHHTATKENVASKKYGTKWKWTRAHHGKGR